MKRAIRIPGQIGIALTAISMPSMSFAQDNNVPQTTANLSDEIVVTARKRSETLQDTPVPVTVLSSEKIDILAIASLDDLSSAVPGLIVGEHSGNSGGSIFLRGVGSGENNALIEQAVATNVDGVVAGSGQIRKAAFIDVDRIEVLRGPQALFFGKNSPGGVISILTADPGDEFEAKLRIGYEMIAHETVFEGIVSTPISENFGIRLAASKLDSNGHLKVQQFNLPTPGFLPFSQSRFPAKDETFFRGTALWQSGPTSAKAKLTIFDAKVNAGTGAGVQRIDCPSGVPQLQPAFECKADGLTQAAAVAPNVIALDPSATNFSPDGFQANKQYLGTLDIRHDFTDAITLTSITGYYDVRDAIGTSYGLGPVNNISVSNNTFDMTQYNQELRLNSDFGGSYDFMLDAYYEERDSRTGTSVTVFNSTYLGREVFDQSQVSYSVAGQLIWRPVEALELSAGSRYSYERKEIDVSFNGAAVPLTKNSRSWNDFSPEVTVAFRPSSTLNIYGSYKQGFKSGGFDAGFGAAARNGKSYDQEQIEGYEAGIKTQLFDRKLIIDAVAYSYDYSGLQVAVFDATTLSLQILNASDAKLRGVELGAVWITPVTGLRVSGGFAYNDTEYGEFITGCYSGQTIAQGCNLGPDPVTGAFKAQNAEGEPLVFAPKTVANFGVDYGVALANDWRLNFFGGWRYSGKYSARAGGRQPSATQDAVSKFDATASVSNAWATIAFKGRNLTNEYTLLRTIDAPFSGARTGTATGVPGDQAANLSRGRELMFELSFKY